MFKKPVSGFFLKSEANVWVIHIGKEIDSEKLIAGGWIKAWLVFDTQAVDKKLLKGLLSGLLDKIKMIKDINVLTESLTEPELIESSEKFKQKGIDTVFSQVLEVEIVAKDFETLLYLVITFGPTTLEVLAPKEIKLDMRQMQNTLILVSELMHRYAAAGPGGLVLTKV